MGWLFLGHGFWGCVDVVVFPWIVVFWRCVDVVVFLGLWFLGMHGQGGLSFGRGFWRCVNVVVFSLWFLGMRGLVLPWLG